MGRGTGWLYCGKQACVRAEGTGAAQCRPAPPPRNQGRRFDSTRAAFIAHPPASRMWALPYTGGGSVSGFVGEGGRQEGARRRACVQLLPLLRGCGVVCRRVPTGLVEGCVHGTAEPRQAGCSGDRQGWGQLRWCFGQFSDAGSRSAILLHISRMGRLAGGGMRMRAERSPRARLPPVMCGVPDTVCAGATCAALLQCEAWCTVRAPSNSSHAASTGNAGFSSHSALRGLGCHHGWMDCYHGMRWAGSYTTDHATFLHYCM